MTEVAQPESRPEASIDDKQASRGGLPLEARRQAPGNEPGVYHPRSQGHHGRAGHGRLGLTGGTRADACVHSGPPQGAQVVNREAEQSVLARQLSLPQRLLPMYPVAGGVDHLPGRVTTALAVDHQCKQRRQTRRSASCQCHSGQGTRVLHHSGAGANRIPPLRLDP